MKALRLLVVSLLVGALNAPSWAIADTTAIEERLNQLEQEVAILKRQLEIEREDKVAKAPTTPVVTASAKDGFSIKTPDDSFKLKIRGLVQLDGRLFTGNDKTVSGSTALSGTDTFTVRRARPIIEGTVARDYDFYLMPDFGAGASTLVDAYLEWKYFPAAKLKAGKFKAPFALERLQSDAVANFIETGLPSNLAPNREVGVQLSGDIFNSSLNYAVGIFNGSADLASTNSQDADNNNDKDVVARFFAQPFLNHGPALLKGLGLGFAASHGHNEGSTLPTYRSPGQASVFSYSSTTADGDHTRYSPQFSFYKGSLGLLGEYIQSEQKVVRGATIRDTFTHKAWQITGNYLLTGELASYKGITPLKPFDLKQGGWGAWEVVGRYGNLDIDDVAFDNGFASTSTAITEEGAWALGLNWYLNKNLRWSLNFEHTDFEGGNISGSDRPDEDVILTRFQLSY